MKKTMLVSFVLLLVLPALASAQQDAEPWSAEPGDEIPGDPVPLSCYGYVGSVDAGTSQTVSFCATNHACEMETQRAAKTICEGKFTTKCAARPCPAGQTCVPFQMAGWENVNLTNCRRLPAAEGVCPGNELCVCDSTVTARLDCGCMCR